MSRRKARLLWGPPKTSRDHDGYRQRLRLLHVLKQRNQGWERPGPLRRARANKKRADTYKHKTADSLMRPEVGTQAQFKKKLRAVGLRGGEEDDGGARNHRRDGDLRNPRRLRWG